MKNKGEKGKWRIWVLILYFCFALQILSVIVIFTLPGLFYYIDVLPRISVSGCPGNSGVILYIVGLIALIFSLLLLFIKKEIKFFIIFIFQILLLLVILFYFACL
jgi:hypothetical protein